MKYNLLLIVMMFMCLGNLQAQSDATLEETINWLNEHSLPNQLTCETCSTFTNLYLSDENSKLSAERVRFRSKESQTRTHEISSYTGITIKKSEKSKYNIIFTVRERYWAFDLVFENKDLALRSLKAFEHLFNLLGQDIKVKNKLVDENKF